MREGERKKEINMLLILLMALNSLSSKRDILYSFMCTMFFTEVREKVYIFTLLKTILSKFKTVHV